MASRRLYTRALVVLLVVLLTAGCLGVGGGDDGEPTPTIDDEPAADPAGSDAESMAAEGPGVQAGAAGADRALITEASVAVTVADLDTARDEIDDIAADHDGFISGSRLQVHDADDGEWRSGVIELRVPETEFDPAMDRIEALGEVSNVETDTTDVTEELADIEARLENLRAERDRLRTLYDDAEDTQAVLAVQRELADVQEDIERLEAQHRSIADSVAYSTITVDLSEERTEPEPEPQWYDRPLTGAVIDSVGAVGTVIRALSVMAAYALPFALVFGMPIVGAAVVYRWHRDS